MQAPFQSKNDFDAVQTKTARTATQEQSLVDSRPTAVAKRKLAEMMNNSPRVLQQQALSDSIRNSPLMVVQCHEINARFGGEVQPQGDGAMPVESSPAQREEKCNNAGLPYKLKSGIESISDMSMDHRTVRYNSDKPAQLQAHAYAKGKEIPLASGQEKQLPHEAWHVVQQAQRRVQPTLQMKAGTVNLGPSLHVEGVETQRVASFVGMASLTDNRPTAVMQHRLSTTISDSARVNQNETESERLLHSRHVQSQGVRAGQRRAHEKVIQRAKPGEAPPTPHSQLTRRLKQIARESDANEAAFVQRMIAIMGAQVVRPAQMELDHPLAAAPDGMAANIVTIALCDQLEADNAGMAELLLFKHAVVQRGQLQAINASILDEFVQQIGLIIDPFFHMAEHQVLTDPAHNSSAELRNIVAAVGPGEDLFRRSATEHLVAARPPVVELNPEQKAALTLALRTMPIVISMLDNTLGQQGNAANLLNGIESTGGAVPTQELIARIQRALSIVGHLVAPEKLPPHGRVPNIEINPDRVENIPQSIWEKLRKIQRTLALPFRPDADRDNNKVRISAMTELDVIVHEFAHQIEFALPINEWRDLQDLLRMRHTFGGLVAIYPEHEDVDIRNEAAFNATMPATGAYSAKVYDDGSTEVMSMTLEYFSTPSKAEKMISQDPLQAAIVLRLIRPEQFNNDLYIPPPLRAMLPRGDIAPPAPAPPAAPVAQAVGNVA